MGLLLLAAALLVAAGGAAAGPAAPEKAAACAACHGSDGNSPDPEVPSLAGQPPLFLFYQLIQFREGRRSDFRMTPNAIGLTDEEMKALAAFFSMQPPRRPARASDQARIAAGRRAAERHHCGDCHAPGFVGQDHIPRLAGQQEPYLLRQLRGFKAQTRADIDGNMTSVAQGLSDEDIEALAYYLARFGSD